ncbi:hypothetical protein [Variovorax atrisoli]|uniref:hypothetical protein n=1 Tax=Variovorax atrisoli TaxID=3394203 RepID=UPI003398BA0C
MSSERLQLRIENQQNNVADEVSALTAVVRPILEGTLYALKGNIVAQVGGFEKVTLMMLARLYRPGDGDCGLCFEWAVHDAMNRQDPLVLDRVTDAMRRFCKVPGNVPASILFGAEKTGALKLIDTASEILTDDSRILVGEQGQPAKLKRYMNVLAAAFRRPEVRYALPYSISGLWKADLFVGNTDRDRWIGTTVKINPRDLEPARGLRLGIVPSRQGKSDRIVMDEHRRLVVCPIPHDAAFMEVFYQGWGIVQQFIAADAQVPKEVNLPRPADRQVAKYLADRRVFPVLDVVEALGPLSQPELLETRTKDVGTVPRSEEATRVGAVIAPKPRRVQG